MEVTILSQASAGPLKVLYVVPIGPALGNYAAFDQLGPGAIRTSGLTGYDITFSNDVLYIPVDPLSALQWGWITEEELMVPAGLHTMLVMLRQGGSRL